MRQRRVPVDSTRAPADTDQPKKRTRPKSSDTVLVFAAPILLTIEVFLVRHA